MQDYDVDGLWDIFVSNGICFDLFDKDYFNYMANEIYVCVMINEDEEVLKKLIDIMFFFLVCNVFFCNEGNLQFFY